MFGAAQTYDNIHRTFSTQFSLSSLLAALFSKNRRTCKFYVVRDTHTHTHVLSDNINVYNQTLLDILRNLYIIIVVRGVSGELQFPGVRTPLSVVGSCPPGGRTGREGGARGGPKRTQPPCFVCFTPPCDNR